MSVYSPPRSGIGWCWFRKGSCRAVQQGTVSAAAAAASICHAAAVTRAGLTSTGPAFAVWCLPWSLLRRCAAVAGRLTVLRLAWRARLVVVTVTVVQLLLARHVGLGLGVAAMAGVSYLLPAAERARARYVTAVGDDGVQSTGLGREYVAMLEQGRRTGRPRAASSADVPGAGAGAGREGARPGSTALMRDAREGRSGASRFGGGCRRVERAGAVGAGAVMVEADAARPAVGTGGQTGTVQPPGDRGVQPQLVPVADDEVGVWDPAGLHPADGRGVADASHRGDAVDTDYTLRQARPGPPERSPRTGCPDDHRLRRLVLACELGEGAAGAAGQHPLLDHLRGGERASLGGVPADGLVLDPVPGRDVAHPLPSLARIHPAACPLVESGPGRDRATQMPGRTRERAVRGRGPADGLRGHTVAPRDERGRLTVTSTAQPLQRRVRSAHPVHFSRPAAHRQPERQPTSHEPRATPDMARTWPVTTWQYSSRRWDPDQDGDEEQWARRVAAEGWRTWLDGPGSWVGIDGRRVRVWSLRRPCLRPFSVHDHAAKCLPQQ